jgi:xanthine dehydrogenase accessory factor
VTLPLDRLALEVAGWLRRETDGTLVRVVGYEGFGGARRGELAAIGPDGTQVGTILGGSLDERVRDALHEPLDERLELVGIDVDGGCAAAAGLTCGGHATVVLQPVSTIPPPFWDALRERTPVALVATPDSRQLLVVDGRGCVHGTLGDPALDRFGEQEARSWLALGRPIAGRTERPELLIQTYQPSRRLLVVGSADLAEALHAQATLLGWEAEVAATVDRALAALPRLGASDALVMLSHDGAVDAPVLAAARERGVGYVGALGSRQTQARRAARLRDLGVPDAWIRGIYGPVGLDLAATNPAETALAVCAEILASAAARPPLPLRDRPGRINAVTVAPAA